MCFLFYIALALVIMFSRKINHKVTKVLYLLHRPVNILNPIFGDKNGLF
jgi:hypothetical protein